MPRFQYTALAAGGKTVKGSVTAESAYAARKQLRTRGIHPTGLKQETTEEQGAGRFSSFFLRSKKREIVEFTKQLAVLLNAGIKLTEALSVLIQQASSVRFKNIVTDIRDRVVTGESLTEALADYTDYFNVIYISMVRVGEATGALDKSLSTVANFMEKRQRVESKLVTAMLYPASIFTFGMFAVIFLTTFVMPKVIDQISKTGQELPLITKMLMSTSYVLRHYWLVIMLVVLLIIAFGKRFLKTERGANMRDRMLLSLPVFGHLIKQRIVARFTSTLSTLLGSGLSMAESLRVVAEVTGNTIMNRAVKKARDRILSGADIATPLRDSGVIDPAIAHMVAVGEKSGELDSMLKNISDNLESASDIVIERLSVILETVVIVTMAVFVFLIAIATLLPILQFSAGNF